jgi:hypothetical protein
MPTGLVRTTTYFDANLLARAKKRAIDEQKSLYELLNEAVVRLLAAVPYKASPTVLPQKFSLDKVFGPPFKSGLKKKFLTRADYYE